MHIYKSRFMSRGEVWFNHEPEPSEVDWIFYRQRSHPVPGTRSKDFYTIVLDLNQDPEGLFNRMSKNTTYKIRRARDKDEVRCRSAMPVGEEILGQFEEHYKRFAAAKGLPGLDRSFVEGLDKDGFLEVSFALNPGGEPLVFHAYYRDSNRSCLLHTISLHETLADSGARNAVGRANRYLFWCDILRHQEEGIKIFDFGGWYPGDLDRERLDINRFKEEFGGTVIREYNCEQVLTLKGRLVLMAAAVLDWARGVAAKLRRRPALRKPESEKDGGSPVATNIGARTPRPLAAVREPG